MRLAVDTKPRLQPPVDYADQSALLIWIVAALIHMDDCVDSLKQTRQWERWLMRAGFTAAVLVWPVVAARLLT